jgi:hypothetical protein
MAANRVGAKLTMWLVGRATEAEVTRCKDALLRSVYREPRLRVGTAGVLVDTAQVEGWNGTIVGKDTALRLRFERGLY